MTERITPARAMGIVGDLMQRNGLSEGMQAIIIAHLLKDFGFMLRKIAKTCVEDKEIDRESLNEDFKVIADLLRRGDYNTVLSLSHILLNQLFPALDIFARAYMLDEEELRMIEEESDAQWKELAEEYVEWSKQNKGKKPQEFLEQCGVEVMIIGQSDQRE